jgi:predicted  nucleic acid-binding Zn-ribbon protein
MEHAKQLATVNRLLEQAREEIERLRGCIKDDLEMINERDAEIAAFRQRVEEGITAFDSRSPRLMKAWADEARRALGGSDGK